MRGPYAQRLNREMRRQRLQGLETRKRNILRDRRERDAPELIQDRHAPIMRLVAVAGNSRAKSVAGLHDGPRIERNAAAQRRRRGLRQYRAGEGSAFADSGQDRKEVFGAAVLALQLPA